MVRSGIAEDGDFTEKVIGLAYGLQFSRGQVMVAGEHVERSNLSGDDRSFFVSNQTPFGGPDGRTTRCNRATARAPRSAWL